MKRCAEANNKGFTLIETIIAIVIGAILGVVIFTYSGTFYTKSSASLIQSAKTFALQKVMENILAEHRYNYSSPGLSAWQASHAYAAGDKIFPTDAKKNGRYYLCITPGTSASTEPGTWPSAIGSTVADGGVVWQEGLQTRIGAEGTDCNSGSTTCVYGRYTVVYNRMFKIQTTDPDNSILKVAIKDDSGEALSVLLNLVP